MNQNKAWNSIHVLYPIEQRNVRASHINLDACIWHHKQDSMGNIMSIRALKPQGCGLNANRYVYYRNYKINIK